MEKFIIISCVLLASAVLQVSSLQCYMCEDCATLNTSSLATCGDTNTTTTTTTTTTTVAPSTNSSSNETNTGSLRHFNGAILATNISVTYYCYKSSYTVNGTEKVDRGCIASVLGITVCPSQMNQTSCSYCNTDKCNGNGANTIKLSFLLLAFITAIFSCKNM